MAPSAKTAEVVIVGGGVMGASAAWHLAARGCTDVVVLERGELGGGSTARATGGFRTQFSTAVNVRLSLLAREKLLRFPAEVGVDSGYRPYGYLFLATDEGQLAALRSLLPMQMAAGIAEAGEVREVGLDEVGRLNPAVRLDGILGGFFGSLDGFIRPLSILEGYATAAQRLGVRFETGVEVTGLTVEESGGERRLTAVETSRGRIAARHVVNAAGAWASVLAKMAGVDLPVVPLRRQVAATRPTTALPADMPMTIFLDDGFHLRMRDGRALLLLPVDLPTANPFDASFEPAWLDAVVARAHARIPRLQSVAIDRAACWAGLYEMSPDKHAIVGPAPGLPNFHLMNGSSGHGVMHSPALGQLIAEEILDGRAHTLDVHALRPSRFAEGEPNRGIDLL